MSRPLPLSLPALLTDDRCRPTRHPTQAPSQMPSKSPTKAAAASLSGGAIAGIVIAVLAAVGMAIFGYSYYNRQQAAAKLTNGKGSMNFEPLEDEYDEDQL